VKIAVLCGPTSQGFLDPVEKILRTAHEVRRFTVTSPITTTHEVKEWGADAAWIEWCDANAYHFSRVLPIPMVVRLHRYESTTEWPAKMDWRSARLVVTSQHILERAERRCKHGLAKWAQPVVIPSIVDFADFPLVEDRGAKELEVAVVGYRNGRKQPGLAFAAFAAICRNWKARIRFIGTEQEPYWDEYLRTTCRRVSIEPWTDDVAAIWKTADVCLSASADEGCPYNVVEAMASGARPLVHHYVGAEAQFPKECLWRTPEELGRSESPLDAMMRWEPRAIRLWAESRYSIESQRAKILSLFAGER
jgi:hypothetical protein